MICGYDATCPRFQHISQAYTLQVFAWARHIQETGGPGPISRSACKRTVVAFNPARRRRARSVCLTNVMHSGRTFSVPRIFPVVWKHHGLVCATRPAAWPAVLQPARMDTFRMRQPWPETCISDSPPQILMAESACRTSPVRFPEAHSAQKSYPSRQALCFLSQALPRSSEYVP